MNPLRNPTPEEIERLILASKHQAARTLTDAVTGDVYVWPAEDATHREAADHLGVQYDRKPGEGDILTL